MSDHLKYVRRDAAQRFNDLWDRVTDWITRFLERYDHHPSNRSRHRARYTPMIDRLAGAPGWVWAVAAGLLTLLTLVVVL